MKIKENLGCIIPILLFCLLIIWIRWSDYDEYIQSKENHKIQKKIDSISDCKVKIKLLNVLYEKDWLSINERRLTLGRIIFEYENLNNFDSALTILKKYENVYEKSLFTTTHEATIHYMKGDSILAQELLKNVIYEKIQYDSMNWFNKIFQRWINSGHGAEYSRYLDYLYNVYCQLYALYNYRNINHDIKAKTDITLKYLKQINELDSIIPEFLSFEQRCPTDADLYDIERKNILMNHLKIGDYKRLSPFKDDIVSMIYNLRAAIVAELIIEYDSLYEKTKTKQVIMENFNAISSMNFPDLLFIKAYKKYVGIDNYFPTRTTYEQYRSFSKDRYRILTLATPTTALNDSSALINQGVFDSFIVLSCNDWSICDSTLFTRETVLKYKGIPKNIIMLRNDYQTDTTCIMDDQIGALLYYIIVPEPVYQMLLYDFFN